jgi:NTE family protein
MKIGLALSGGGARGIMHLGVIKALYERGIYPHCIAGTSAGGIAGAMIASGYTPDEALQVLTQIKFIKYLRPAFSTKGLLKMEKAQRLYEKYLPHNSFEKLNIPLTVVATDIEAGQSVYFDAGPLYLPLMATSCLPGIFEPVLYQKMRLVDGAILNNLPIEPLQNTVDIIIGSNCNPHTFSRPLRSVRGVIERSLLLAIRNKTQERIRQCTICFNPIEIGKYELYDVGKAQEIFKIGYEAVVRESATLDAIL